MIFRNNIGYICGLYSTITFYNNNVANCIYMYYLKYI